VNLEDTPGKIVGRVRPIHYDSLVDLAEGLMPRLPYPKGVNGLAGSALKLATYFTSIAQSTVILQKSASHSRGACGGTGRLFRLGSCPMLLPA
jgi:hypothetical protein